MIDNLDLFYMRERELAEAEGRRPHCYICGEPIWQDKALRLPDGMIWIAALKKIRNT